MTSDLGAGFCTTHMILLWGTFLLNYFKFPSSILCKQNAASDQGLHCLPYIQQYSRHING